jgi:hypothetical protein
LAATRAPPEATTATVAATHDEGVLIMGVGVTPP